MIPPMPKNSLETAYRLVVDIAEMLLINNVPLHQYDDRYPFVFPTPSKAETEISASSLLTPSGERYKEDPNNAVVIPQDLLDRLSTAISDLSEIEEAYWSGE